MDEQKRPENVPYIVLEGLQARDERMIRRLWIALLSALAALVLTNAGWLLYLSQYDFTDETITVDSQDGGNASFIARDGDIYYGDYYTPPEKAEAQGQ